VLLLFFGFSFLAYGIYWPSIPYVLLGVVNIAIGIHVAWDFLYGLELEWQRRTAVPDGKKDVQHECDGSP
jgi:hypothetical protein